MSRNFATPASLENVIHRSTADQIADAAVWALREEAWLTPKPGLVDQRGSGAHYDMDLGTLLRSASALHSSFVSIASHAMRTPFGMCLSDQLHVIGKDAETRMLAATGGVNTHRGAIWALGLLTAASAASATEFDAKEVCEWAGRLARLPGAKSIQPSHGRTVFLRHGARGARGEAEDGFPHLHKVALPALNAARVRYRDEAMARLHVLMVLMARIEDTCLLFRGGCSALTTAQSGAIDILACGIDTPLGRAKLGELDSRLLEMKVSPGGCADLLAAALFLDRLMTMEAPHGNA